MMKTFRNDQAWHRDTAVMLGQVRAADQAWLPALKKGTHGPVQSNVSRARCGAVLAGDGDHAVPRR